jgi:type IV pilus assembly protein PilZ
LGVYHIFHIPWTFSKPSLLKISVGQKSGGYITRQRDYCKVYRRGSMKKGTSQGEHRKTSRTSTRISTVIRIDYHTTDSFFTDFADNISNGGMFIATTKPLKQGTQLSLEFLLPECDYPVHVKAKMAWSRNVPSENQKRGMGVQFDNLSPSAKDKINTIVKRLRSVP